MRQKITIAMTIAVGSTLSWPASVWGVVEDGYQAPKAQGTGVPWKAVVLLGVMLVGILAVVLRDSRRTQSRA
ncbi:MAG: hypothetical protein DRP83_07285 [Planctomycetota bacterium]|nr:MAG: hypothetical protein DRP83_07285 [Planctomycetota bacterium]